MMFDWFGEPMMYYRPYAPRRMNVFDRMDHWFDEFDREMEEEFDNFSDPFFDRISHKKPIKQERKVKPMKKRQPKRKVVDEEETEPHFYSFSSSMYTGSDGVQHIYKEETDSKSGKKKVVETRAIGNKSITLHRITDKDGNVEEHETRKNIKDDEVDDFKNKWIAKNVNKNAQLPEPKKANVEEEKTEETEEKKE